MADEQEGQVAVEEGGAPQAAPAKEAGAPPELVARMQELEGQNQRLAAAQLEQLINGLPENQREAAKLEVAKRLMAQREAAIEAAAKRTVIREAALEHGLPIEEFAEIAKDISNPQTIVRLAQREAKLRKEAQAERQRASEARGTPAAAETRPDSGGGSGAGRPTYDEITRKYRGTGQIAAMRRELAQYGYQSGRPIERG